MRRSAVFFVAALACLVLLPNVAHAQSAIVGVVKDTSGAVLPGVTVEASSDVLIEKTRSVTTDGNGQYDFTSNCAANGCHELLLIRRFRHVTEYTCINHQIEMILAIEARIQ